MYSLQSLPYGRKGPSQQLCCLGVLDRHLHHIPTLGGGRKVSVSDFYTKDRFLFANIHGTLA
jgi:hypothetical protein